MQLSNNIRGGISPLILLGEIILLAILTYLSPSNTEFSPLECGQIAVLSLGLIIALHAFGWGNKLPAKARPYFLMLACMMLFCIMREISYGRSFYYDESYNLRPELKKYYKSLPLVMSIRAFAYGLLIFTPLYLIYQQFKFSLLALFKQVKLYAIDLIALVLCPIVASWAEHQLECPQIEEAAELALYLVLLNICWKYARNQDQVWC